MDFMFKKTSRYTSSVNDKKKEKVPLYADNDVINYFSDANIAILYSNIRFWCEYHKTNEDEAHFHDGKYWVYYSRRALSEKFPFWNDMKIYRMLKKLVKAGFLLESSFNTYGPDRTKWYTTDTE
jgi:hypothetical protein